MSPPQTGRHCPLLHPKETTVRWVGGGHPSKPRTDAATSATVVSGGFDNHNLLSTRSGTTSSSRVAATAPNKNNVIFVSELDRGHSDEWNVLEILKSVANGLRC